MLAQLILFNFFMENYLTATVTIIESAGFWLC